MTTTRGGDRVGGYTVRFDAGPDRDYPWDVLDESGTLLDSFAARYKAIDDARARGRAAGRRGPSTAWATSAARSRTCWRRSRTRTSSAGSRR